MGKMYALVRRELSVYFVSPLAYVILTGMLLVTGVLFASWLDDMNKARMAFSFMWTLQLLTWIIILICPFVTARLIAEEKNRGTLETMMTAPISDLQVVLSKYAAAMTFIGYLMLPTLFFVFLVRGYADVDWGAVLTGYLGVFITASWLVGIGIFVSALCSSQMTAGILTLILDVGMLFLHFIRPDIEWLRDFLHRIDLMNYMSDFYLGILDTRQLVLGLSISVFFLFLTMLAMGSRRWR